ncbi:hypothetical protein WCE39_13470 [Luteimonas sp. MJ174]|uniref:hypothetical protein n=1 Tax=Luteimonas sp. MJ174 TaxID=3129237 RepID=UPI0031BA7539
MNNDDWVDLAAEWNAADAPDPAVLQSRMRRYRWRNRLGLVGEFLGALVALVLSAWAWTREPDLRPWLLVAGTVVVAWQVGYLLIRQRYRLFGLPAGGLVGMIDAEVRRAKFVIATLWLGLAGGLLLIPLALLTLPAIHHPRLLTGLLIAAAAYVPYVVLRTFQLARRVESLRVERHRLEG